MYYFPVEMYVYCLQISYHLAVLSQWSKYDSQTIPFDVTINENIHSVQ